MRTGTGPVEDSSLALGMTIKENIMQIAIGADHEGYVLKDEIVQALTQEGHEVRDFGTHGPEPVDYPDYARTIGEEVRSGKAERGILVCGSGIGVAVAANKLRGIRAGLCHDAYSAHQSVEHDNINVLCLGPQIIGNGLAMDLVHIWLNARFSGAERHTRRLDEIQAIEQTEAGS
jgi:ribose 5-phosphate isomerase B